MGQTELIQRAKTGDRMALVNLLRSIEHSVYRSAYYMLGNEKDALDASQETLTCVYREINSFDEKDKFSMWVQRIVTNICIDKLHLQREPASIKEDGAPSQGKNDEEHTISMESLSYDNLNNILKLPKQSRLVLVLRYLHELTYHEIAGILELPMDTVKSYLFHARQQLSMNFPD
jgi:RNA polymerase sigma factor (sigma-70 family)